MTVEPSAHGTRTASEPPDRRSRGHGACSGGRVPVSAPWRRPWLGFLGFQWLPYLEARTFPVCSAGDIISPANRYCANNMNSELDPFVLLENAADKECYIKVGKEGGALVWTPERFVMPSPLLAGSFQDEGGMWRYSPRTRKYKGTSQYLPGLCGGRGMGGTNLLFSCGNFLSRSAAGGAAVGGGGRRGYYPLCRQSTMSFVRATPNFRT